jgi:hypothetical protein
MYGVVCSVTLVCVCVCSCVFVSIPHTNSRYLTLISRASAIWCFFLPKKALNFFENLRLEEAVEAVVHVAYSMFENGFIAMR